MNNSRTVRGAQPGQQLDRHIQNFTDRETSSADQFADGVAFNVLSGNEEAVFRFAHIINRQDIWVIQGRSRASFDLKSPHAFVIEKEISAQNFQSNQPFETGVLSEINVPHPAAADPLNNPVRSNLM